MPLRLSLPTALLAVATSTAALATEANVTADIASGSEARGSLPSDLVATGGFLVFNAAGSIWQSDGTVEGTKRVIEGHFENAALLGPGLVFSVETRTGYPREIASTSVWVKAGDATKEERLLPESFLLGGEAFHSYGDQLVVSHATALWITDGRPGNAIHLARGFVGPVSTAGPWIHFERSEPESGHRLWRSDGTLAGTRLATDLPLGVGAGQGPPFSGLAPLPDAIVFLADNEDGGMRLWRLGFGEDDTASLVTDLAPAAIVGSRLRSSVLVGNTAWLMFEIVEVELGAISHRCELWQSAGTAADTALVETLPGDCPDELASAGGVIYFVHTTAELGSELWSFRPASGALALVADLAPGTPSSLPTQLLAFGDRLAFLAQLSLSDLEDPHRRLLYVTDGTVPGTVLVADIPQSSTAPGLAKFGAFLYFAGWDAVNGYELWRSDGTPDGTELSLDLQNDVASSSPHQMLRHGQEILLLAEDGPEGPRLFRSDGTASGTQPVEGSPSHLGRVLGVVDQRAVVEQTFDYDRTRLWAIGLDDGLATVLGDFALGPPSYLPTTLVDIRAVRDALVLEDRIVFAGRTTTNGLEPWVTDGTPGGTRMLADLAPGSGPSASGVEMPFESRPTELVRVGDNVYFTTYHDQSPRLWRTDGQHSPELVTTLHASSKLRALGELLFSVGGNPQLVLDTRNGQLRNLYLLGCGSCLVLDAVPLRGRLAMLVSREDTSPSLYWSDGSQAGTYQATELPLLQVRSSLLSSGGRLFFRASNPDPTQGQALWTSDGTSEGTRRLLDFPLGVHQPPGPTLLGIFDGVLLFAARTPGEGVELWRSDGYEEGTFRLTDLFPGPASSAPLDAVALGDRVHFAATAPEVGRELFHVPRSTLARSCVSDANTECLNQRFEVSVDWLAPDTGANGRATAVPATDDTATFWFFDEENVELAVKILDGRSLSAHHWLYYGALSDVAYWVTATDVDTGRTISYRNPAATLCGHGDVLAFPDDETPPLEAAGLLRAGGADTSAIDRQDLSTAPGACSGVDVACLVGGRFQVEVTWFDPAQLDPELGHAASRPGVPRHGTDDTAAFWFFDAANLELLVKVLDGRHLNERFWVYYGALSDVAYEIRVTDTSTGEVRIYRNPHSMLCGAADVEAF